MICALLPTSLGPLLFADGAIRTTFEWGRIQSRGDWVLPIAVFVALMLFVRWMYRRDAAELPLLLRWLLTALRTATLLGILILYLQPQWRSERETAHNSRAVLLVDTSLSMGLADGPASQAGLTPQTGPAVSRLEQVASALGQSDFLRRLRKTHDVVVRQFNENLDSDRLRALAKLRPEWAAAASAPAANKASNKASTADGDDDFDWSEFLKPRGTDTQLGLALRQLVDDESGSPLAGIVLLSDGGQNAGPSIEDAVAAAQKAKIPVFTIGLGSDRKPASVRVSDLAAPARAYPGDRYTVTGYLQAQGLAGQVVDVQLFSRQPSDSAGGSDPQSGELLAERPITLGGDGEVVPVKFELTPAETGRRTLCFRIKDAPGDPNAADNFREVDIEIVDRKNRVLMLAGGPMREYQFLRNQLFRDRTTTVDVLLQTAQPGVSQDAEKVLDAFPATRQEMAEYDCVVALDPDWQTLDAAEIDLLEEWVAGQGGGLVVVPGPVFAGSTIGGWIEAENMTKIRALYPVEFYRRFSPAESGLYAGEEPWPLDFTREGVEAEFLWLADSATAARQAWAGFEGVYGCFPVRGPKPGATVFARFSDPRTGQGDQRPVFLAEQFYGSGRVFYIGSAEMWRLRKADEAYFEQFYTKLIRHVSQGRLLRGSSRGVLLVGQDRYLLGNTVEVRAQLTDLRLNPLDVPSVAVQVVHPDATVQTLMLQPDPARAGTYAGRFPVLSEGAYRLELPIPESDGESLTRRIQVNMPDLERENPQRNDALLSRIAASTGGKYYVGLDPIVHSTAAESLVEQLKDCTRTVVIPLEPNRQWEETWLRWMMYALCGLLCGEWLIRRLVKLA